MAALAVDTDLNKAMEGVDMVPHHHSNTVAILSKVIHSRATLHKATSKVTAQALDMVAGMAEAEVDMEEAAINKHLPRSQEVSVPEVPQLWVWVVV